MEYHTTVQKIKELLEENDVWFETFEHEPVRTSEEAAKIRPGYSLKQGAKAIIVRVKINGGTNFFSMLVFPGNKRFDNEKVKRFFKAKDIRFATEEEVKQITDGIEPGGVPPFGNLFNLQVVFDPTLSQNERIVFNAGDKRYSIAMRAKDYINIVKPAIENVV